MRSIFASALAAGLIASPLCAATISNPTVTSHRATGPSSAIDMEVKDYPAPGAPVYYVLLLQQLNNVKAGDIIQVFARAEITNDLGYNVELQCSLKWTTSAGNTTGTNVTPESGYNLTPDMHHGIVQMGAVFDVPADSSSMNMSFICYAGGGSSTGPTDKVRVEPNYGYMHILHYKPSSP